MQNIFEFGGTIAGLRLCNKGLGSFKQITEARKPNRSVRPKPKFGKSRNGPESIEFSSMRIAAQILQLCQFSKQRTTSRISDYCLELIKSGDFVDIKEVSYVLKKVLCLIHND
ncbi:MAG: hypothetical protein JRD87_13290, partial [Deltaproteobacteria bacterium]|nr:hypothetical protein [Deltaproteobacteria bacterium]